MSKHIDTGVQPAFASDRALSALQLDIAYQILRLIRQERLPAGARLKEEPLASRFGVSRSPVRAALKFLAAKEIVEAQAHRGFALARSSDAIQPEQVVARRSDEERLYRAIAGERFAGRLDGHVSEASLLRRFAANRGTLRRVLARMSREGLIQRNRGHGWTFMPALDAEEVYDESYDFRMQVEIGAILSPRFRLDDAQARRCRVEHEALLDGELDVASAARIFEADAAFHQLVGAASRNRFFRDAVDQHTRLRRLSDYQYVSDRERLAESLREHLTILDSLERDERETAARLMREHIRVSRDLRPHFGASTALD